MTSEIMLMVRLECEVCFGVKSWRWQQRNKWWQPLSGEKIGLQLIVSFFVSESVNYFLINRLVFSFYHIRIWLLLNYRLN